MRVGFSYTSLWVWYLAICYQGKKERQAKKGGHTGLNIWLHPSISPQSLLIYQYFGTVFAAEATTPNATCFTIVNTKSRTEVRIQREATKMARHLVLKDAAEYLMF